MDLMDLDRLKNKEERDRSAVASQDVKRHLAHFLKSRGQGSTSQISSIASSSAISARDGHPAGPCNQGALSGSLVANTDDHPLRKTASMPTMHIQYKAPTRSRRRQVERRTTASPLARPRQRSQPMASQMSSRSLSQSNSPPPAPHPPLTGSSSGHHGQRTATRACDESRMAKSGGQRGTSSPAGSSASPTRFTSQHMLVNETLRSSLLKKASSRGKIFSGSSLDVELDARAAGKTIGTNNPAGQATSVQDDPRRDQFRQLSLDSADKLMVLLNPNIMRDGFECHRLSAAKTTTTTTTTTPSSTASSTTTTSAAACGGNALTNEQTIGEMQAGLSITRGGQASLQQQHQATAGQQANQMLVAGRAQKFQISSLYRSRLGKLYSSSSSSTSRDDSFDESSSSRNLNLTNQRWPAGSSGLYQQQQQGLTGQAQPQAAHQANSSLVLTSAVAAIGQDMLPESFNQLQLNNNQIQPTPVATSGAIDLTTATRHPNSPANRLHQSLLLSGARTSSLDRPGRGYEQTFVQHPLLGSLARQCQLTASAHNLLLAADLRLNSQSTVAANYGSDQTMLSASAPISQEQLIEQLGASLSHSDRITSYQLANLMRVPEPARQQILIELLQRSHLAANTELAACRLLDYPADRSTSSLMSRTLSSPLLASEVAGLNFLSANSKLDSDIDDNESNISNHNNNSLDLSLRSSLSGDNRLQEPGVTIVDNTTSTTSTTSCQLHTQLADHQFKFKPADDKSVRAKCKFIYNPVFDPNSSTGLTYDLEMCNHKCTCANESNHAENSLRVLAIWRRLFERGLMARCARIESRKASFEELGLCHGEMYVSYFATTPEERILIRNLDLRRLAIEGLVQLKCKGVGAEKDTFWNEYQTPGAARLAAGCVIEASVHVAKGRLMNAFAIVRPPGHLAEEQQPVGFCFFNSVAIAAKLLVSQHKVARVLIVDWDVHHGSGIQNMFYSDPSVMYISLHRFDKGGFYPGSGAPDELGAGLGKGFNWNIAWSGGPMGDAEYLAAFRTLVMPIAREYSPSMVLVACGFDAARGHPKEYGEYTLSPACFAEMTRQLMHLAHGRLVLCLEGGYQIDVICDCAEACVRALLDCEGQRNEMDKLAELELRRPPNRRACADLMEVSKLAGHYWRGVDKWRNTIELSALEASNLAGTYPDT